MINFNKLLSYKIISIIIVITFNITGICYTINTPPNNFSLRTPLLGNSDEGRQRLKGTLPVTKLQDAKTITPLLTLDDFLFGNGESKRSVIGRNVGIIGLTSSLVLYNANVEKKMMLFGSGIIEPLETISQVPVIDNNVTVRILDKNELAITALKEIIKEKRIPLDKLIENSVHPTAGTVGVKDHAELYRYLGITDVNIEDGHLVVNDNVVGRLQIEDPADIRDFINKVPSKSLPVIFAGNLLNNIIHQKGFDWKASTRLYKGLERILARGGMMAYATNDVYFHWYNNHEERAKAPGIKETKNVIQVLEDAGLDILFKATTIVSEYEGSISDNCVLITGRPDEYSAFPAADEAVEISRESLKTNLPQGMEFIERTTTFNEFKQILESGKETNLVLIKVGPDKYVSFNVCGRYKEVFTILARYKEEVYFGIQDRLAEIEINKAHSAYHEVNSLNGIRLDFFYYLSGHTVLPRQNLIRNAPLGIFIRSADPYWYYRNLRISGKLESALSLLGTFKPQKPKESEAGTERYTVYDDRSFKIKPEEPSYGTEPLELEEVITGSKDLLEGMFSNLIKDVSLGGTKAVIGMGNRIPNVAGFESTPHNLGHMVIEVLSRYFQVELKEYPELHCRIGEVKLGKGILYLIQNDSDINYCGRPFKDALNYIGNPECIVVSDNISKSMGGIYLNSESSEHHGIESVRENIGYEVPILSIGADVGAKSILPIKQRVIQKYPISVKGILVDTLATAALEVVWSVSGQSKEVLEDKVEVLKNTLKGAQKTCTIQPSERHGDRMQSLSSKGHLELFEMASAFWQETGELREIFETALGFLKRHGIDRSKLHISVLKKSERERNINNPYFTYPDVYSTWLEVGISPDQIEFKDPDTNLWRAGGYGIEDIFGTGASGWPEGESTEIFFGETELINILMPTAVRLNDRLKGEKRYLDVKLFSMNVGLERLAMITQEKRAIFDIDTIAPLCAAIRNNIPKAVADTLPEYELEQLIYMTADHLRALAFLVCDGAVLHEQRIRESRTESFLRQQSLELLRDMRVLQIDYKACLKTLLKTAVSPYAEIYPELAMDLSIEQAVQLITTRAVQLSKLINPNLVTNKSTQTPGIIRKLKNKPDYILTEEDYNQLEQFGLSRNDINFAAECFRVCAKTRTAGEAVIFIEDFIRLASCLGVSYQELKSIMTRELGIKLTRDQEFATLRFPMAQPRLAEARPPATSQITRRARDASL